MSRWSAGLLLAALVVALTTRPSPAADEPDAPRVQLDARADINSFYTFVSPRNDDNVVLVMTVNPFVVPGVDAVFAPDVLYQFKIDNTGDFREDMVIQCLFSNAPNQQVTVLGPARPSKVGASDQILNRSRYTTASGAADGKTISGRNGMMAFAGIVDDPFFFDLVYVFRELGVLPGGPLTRSPGIDFFGGLNISALVIEVPAAALKGQTNMLGVWGTTSRAKETKRFSSRHECAAPPYIQVQRMGFPAVKTANGGYFAFFALGVAKLVAINEHRAYSNETAVLLPDILPLDVTSTKGFPQLNGRRLQDDVIDVIFSTASSRRGWGDNVGANDRPFRTEFPYLALPHDPAERIPPRS